MSDFSDNGELTACNVVGRIKLQQTAYILKIVHYTSGFVGPCESEVSFVIRMDIDHLESW